MNSLKHRPLCAVCALAIALACVRLPLPARADGAYAPPGEYVRQEAPAPDTALAREVLGIVNSDRAAHNLPAMRMDEDLCEAAYERALEITRRFSHTRPDGSRFSTICEGAYAENIARGQRSAARVMAAWISSPGHRKNILNPRYDAIGICALEQNGVMHWVQLFGRSD